MLVDMGGHPLTLSHLHPLPRHVTSYPPRRLFHCCQSCQYQCHFNFRGNDDARLSKGGAQEARAQEGQEGPAVGQAIMACEFCCGAARNQIPDQCIWACVWCAAVCFRISAGLRSNNPAEAETIGRECLPKRQQNS